MVILCTIKNVYLFQLQIRGNQILRRVNRTDSILQSFDCFFGDLRSFINRFRGDRWARSAQRFSYPHFDQFWGKERRDLSHKLIFEKQHNDLWWWARGSVGKKDGFHACLPAREKWEWWVVTVYHRNEALKIEAVKITKKNYFPPKMWLDYSIIKANFFYFYIY